jgi:hypothetical protein
VPASGSNIPRRPSTRRSTWCFRAHFELAGLDLGDVENVVDQVEQVVAGRVDRLGELDLLGAEVAFGVLRQQLGQDQRAVQRRAQFVGHVGEEFGLVLARALQLVGALLQLTWAWTQLVVLAVQRSVRSANCSLVCSSSACWVSRWAWDSLSATALRALRWRS